MMNTRRRRDRQWSSLPNELLIMIGERLDTRIDVLRFRAVCMPWRSSIPPLVNTSPPLFPIKLPLRYPGFVLPLLDYTYLRERTIYRLEPPGQDNNNLKSPSKGWLVKVEEWKPDKFRIFNLLSQQQIRYTPQMLPKILNLLDFRIFELSKAYSLEYVRPNNNRSIFNKSVFSADESAVLVINDGGRLACLRLRDDHKWTHLAQAMTTCYTDIMLYNGKFHAIDKCGQVVVIDYSSLKITEVWPRLHTSGNKNRFVQSLGDLYVISNTDWSRFGMYDFSLHHNSLYFQIYKLNEAGWMEVKSLVDQVAFLGKDCSFFVSAEQLDGCKANCIYFSDDSMLNPSEDDGHNIRVFNLVDRSFSPLLTWPANFQVFWPPPTWLRKAKISDSRLL